MLSKFVLSTLTTVHTMMSPLAPNAGGSNVAWLVDLKGSGWTHVSCHDKETGAVKSALRIEIEHVVPLYFTARLSGRLCISGSDARDVDLSMNLPSELLDEAKLESLPVGLGYVVSGVPLASDEKTKARVKLVRQAAVDGMTPIEVEWLTAVDEDEPAHEPVTIWIGKSKSEDASYWQKLRVAALDKLLTRSIEMRGSTADAVVETSAPKTRAR